MRYDWVVPVVVTPMSVVAVTDLVNGWGSAPRLVAGEESAPYPSPDVLCEELGIGPSAGSVTDRALARVSDALYPVFVVREVAECASVVNGLLAETEVVPILRQQNDRLWESWAVHDPRAAVLAAAALTLRTQLSAHGVTRLGTCAGRRCADVYIDASPGGRRRFCSVTCQNRARVATFRRRQAAATR
jgi:CGNR zinc finger